MDIVISRKSKSYNGIIKCLDKAYDFYTYYGIIISYDIFVTSEEYLLLLYIDDQV